MSGAPRLQHLPNKDIIALRHAAACRMACAVVCTLAWIAPASFAWGQTAATPPAEQPATPAAAAPVEPPAKAGLSLTDAIRMSLRNSNDAIRIENEKVNAAAGKVKQAAGAFDWTVSGEGGYQTLYVPHVVGVNGQTVLTNQTDTVGTGYISSGIGRTFRNGISVRPGITAYPSAGASVAQTLGLTQLRPTLGIQIPLLRGEGEIAADAVERGAQETLKGTVYARDFAIASLINDTVQIYWRCLAEDEVARNTEEADKRAGDYERSLREMAGRGLIEPTVAQRAGANAVSRKLSVHQAQADAESCHHELAAATMDSAGKAGARVSGDLPRLEGMAETLDHLDESALLALALDNRADAKAAAQKISATQAALDAARDGTSPAVALNLEPDRATIRYSQSIENNTAEGTLAEADANSAQAKITLSQLQTRIGQQIALTLRNLRAAYSDWKMLQDAVGQMQVVVIDAGGRARLGVTDRSDFLAAQNELADIKNKMVNARLQFASSLATLRLVTGTIQPATQPPDMLAANFMSPAIH